MFYILTLFLIMPVRLPAPDMPGTPDSFALLDEIRAKVLKRDKEAYLAHYNDFKKKLARLESSNNWKEFNQFGYIGKYQFGKSALAATGYDHVNPEEFMKDPNIFPEKDQEKAMDELLRLNEVDMRNYFEQYIGLTLFDTIPITRTGILAAAHLSGPANVKMFFDTNGERNPKDRMGTRLSDYLHHFSR
ncbi:MAG: transglycosylase family protein [Bacteroidales bacterium]|nr:transglycosylase family protein [Bacteroidales bacterium]